MKIRFKKSPTGDYGLAYFVGDEATVSDEQGKLLIEADFAEAVTPEEVVEKKQDSTEPVKKPGRPKGK